jgi:hypothetical protein
MRFGYGVAAAHGATAITRFGGVGEDHPSALLFRGFTWSILVAAGKSASELGASLPAAQRL